MITWTAVEDAIIAWVRAGSGLDAEHVYWTAKRPTPTTGPYITARVIAVRGIGQDWVDVVDAAVPAPGAEIEHRVRGTREMLLRLQCFPGTPDGASTGAGAAVMLLDQVKTSQRLPPLHDALDAAGIGVLGSTAPTAVDGVVGSTIFEARAVMEVRCSLAPEVSVPGTYIQFVELESVAPMPLGSRFVPEDPNP